MAGEWHDACPTMCGGSVSANEAEGALVPLEVHLRDVGGGEGLTRTPGLEF